MDGVRLPISNSVQEFPPIFSTKSLIGKNPKFLMAVEKIPLLAQSKATVLIMGETGTGKELFARAIHYHGPRKGKPFIPVNCGALPDHMVENELFGHVKGAYTDASTEQKGLLAEGEGGTIFLDEIDTLSLPAQIKLLRLLQDQEYRPLGSPKTVTANVRILAATNTDLRHRIHSGQFREDLYFRILILPLAIPPLRERTEDIPLLANGLAKRIAQQAGQAPGRWTPQAMHKLLTYTWPGNVRELEAVIQRTLTFYPGQEWQAKHIDLGLSPSQESEGEDSCSLQRAKAKAIEKIERAYLTRVMASNIGNISRAAKVAGKERRAFQRLLKKYGIDRKTFFASA